VNESGDEQKGIGGIWTFKITNLGIKI